MTPRCPAVFFDRDNTLIANDGYLGDPAGVVLVDGAAELVARVRGLGFATVVFSNQSGVARGMFGEDDVRAVNARLDQLLAASDPDALIDRHEFCPFHPEATVAAYRHESDLRKPKPGMIHQAADAMGLDLRKSWVIGDAPRDIEAGKAAGCRTILLAHPSLSPSPATEAESNIEADFVVSSLAEAGDMIERELEITRTLSGHVAPPASAEAAASPEPRDPSTALRAGPSTSLSAGPSTALRAGPAPKGATATKTAPPGGERSFERLESLAEEILDELRRRDDVRADFSITKLIAGIVQVIALATLFIAYLKRDSSSLEATLLTALIFQALTIALLIMERQRV
jgi:D-glycero-D-manno-heptose 1,7-bisphosphate phosphatase